MQMLYLRMAVVAVLAALPVCAGADVYRCTGTDGKTLYSDSPCPDGAKQESNITTSVGACSTGECEAKRQQEMNDARERLRGQQEELAELADKRRRAELEAERERAALEEQRWRSSVDAWLSAAEEAAGAAAYPVYPYAPGIRPCGPRCINPRPRPPHASQQPVPRLWNRVFLPRLRPATAAIPIFLAFA